jgi:tRNA dimethylallyltransferase
MKYYIVTFGCQMNYSDSQKIAAKLENLGHKKSANQKAADLLIFNACSVRQGAINRVYGQLANFPNKKIIVAGCVLPKDKQKLRQKGVQIWQPNEYFYEPPIRENNFSALIPIMTGCNNFCSYCVVPFTRGREKSRPAKEIINETKTALKNGYKEIILIGQNVNSYIDKEINFPSLLETINNLPGNFWLTFITSHPKDMSDKLIETAAKSQKVIPHVHLPVQSGDDKILRAMKRNYTAAHYKNLVKKIRTAFKKYRPGFPPVTITTDIIVGFPGETKKQFENTAKLMREVKFDMGYLAQYSPRPGTAANRLTDNVTSKEKKRREEFLNDILRETARQSNKKYIGQNVEVLIKEIKNGFAFGKTTTNKTVRINAKHHQKLIPGTLLDIKITDATPWGLASAITNNSSQQKIIAVVGPTSSGKSALAVKLAKKFNGEIISADSRQVYRGMNLGTGKITKKEMAGIPHYLLDVASPRARFTVAQYKKLGQAAIKKIQKKNKLPIVCGGSGFYIRALLDDLTIPAVKPNLKLRAQLEKKPTAQLFAMLKKLDPRRAKIIDRHNPRRLIRALEIIKTTGKKIPVLQTAPADNVLFIGIKITPVILARRIKNRLQKRLRQGMLQEIKNLRAQGLSWKKMDDFGLEYRWLAKYLQNKTLRHTQGKLSYQEMITRLQKDIEHYAKRQMTWFEADKRILWIKNKRGATKAAENFLKK